MSGAPAPVLVTGGAGYVGSHIVGALLGAGCPVVVLDDLSSGRREAVPAAIPLVVGDVGDRRLLDGILRQFEIAAVIHCAAFVSVSESLARPGAYYDNNALASHVLISACLQAGIHAFVYSSTAAVYGEPVAGGPVGEDAPTAPLSPYGRAKLVTEWMLHDADAAHGLPHVVLRYFNVAGADPNGRSGPGMAGGNHLIKVACEVACGRRRCLPIFGTDYPTRDGTCVRDYIHVSDLAAAHVLALRHLLGGGASLTLNCGYGRGFSVREVMAAMVRVAGKPLEVTDAPRRPGDVAEIVADARRIRTALAWQPTYDDLEVILAHALTWERQLISLQSGHQLRL